MADQPNQAMTLREAVKIDRAARGQWSSKMPFTLDQWLRARAIVDAAVEAHEALCAVLESGAERGDDGPEKRLLDAHFAANDKLRALERGEDPKP